MSRRITAAAHIESGELVVHNKRDFLDRCASLKGDVRVTVEKETRSLAQNNLWRAWDRIIGSELGLDPDDVHEMMKARVNMVHRTYVDKRTGEIKDESFPGPTRNLAKDEMAEKMDMYLREAAEMGIWLPASEDEWMDFEARGRKQQ